MHADQGVQDYSWPTILDDASKQMKQVVEKMNLIEEREDLLRVWSRDMKEIGNIPCIEPGKNGVALEALAIFLETFHVLTKCLV